MMQSKIPKNLIELIGNTPMIQLVKSYPEGIAGVFAKLEYHNPGGSIKDRIAWGMILQAEMDGKLKPGGTIIEPTTGNTGIGLAMIAAARGYKLILVVPDDLSVERRRLLLWFGSELVFTPTRLGMEACVREAEKLLERYDNSVLLHQFDNPANPATHRKTTAEEIWKNMEGEFDAFVAGVGTGGTLTGCAEIFKERNPNIKIIAVEPKESPVLSGGEPGFHRILGIGAGFIPKNLRTDLIDEVIQISESEAFLFANKIGRKEGLSIGMSGGAAAAACLKIASPLGVKRKVVTVFPDSWERYINLEKFFTS